MTKLEDKTKEISQMLINLNKLSQMSHESYLKLDKANTSTKSNQVPYPLSIHLMYNLIFNTSDVEVSLLASGLGLRTARKVSSRWNLEADFLR